MPTYVSKKKLNAVQFRPDKDHKMQLPVGLYGINSPGADNWNYAGCKFFTMDPDGKRHYCNPGDYIVEAPFGEYFSIPRHQFEKEYELV